MLILSLVAGGWRAAGADKPERRFRLAAITEYSQARAAAATNASNLTNQIRLAQACFEAVEYATNKAERALLSEQGISAAKAALAQNTNSGPAHYYLGVNLGQLARTRGLSALKLVDRMEEEVLKAAELDPGQDQAGPHRILGLLYRDAPSIGSVGSRTKARIHLQKAGLLAPDFPENRLNLLESYLDWKDRAGASKELKATEELLPKALQQFSGPEWEAHWLDWDARFKQAKARAEKDPKILKTPREEN